MNTQRAELRAFWKGGMLSTNTYWGAHPVTVPQSILQKSWWDARCSKLHLKQKHSSHRREDGKASHSRQAQTMIQVTRRNGPVWSVSCLFLLKFSQRPRYSELWEETNDYYEKQNNLLYKSSPGELGCLQHLEHGQAGVNSSTARRSDQVYNLQSVHRASVPR